MKYVLENKSNRICLVRPHNNKSIQKRLEPTDYLRVGELEQTDIDYYRQLAKKGLHLVRYDQFLMAKGMKEELKNYLAERDEEVSEEELETVEETEEEQQDEELVEEVSIEETDEEEQQDEEPVEEENKYADLTEQGLKEMEEDEVRDIAEELDIGNYWNKRIDNLAKDILAEVKE